MINLTYTPMRADFKADYSISNDILVVQIGEKLEQFDFTNLAEGMAEAILPEVLEVNPIVNAEKVGDTVNITVIRFYTEDEKALFEVI